MDVSRNTAVFDTPREDHLLGAAAVGRVEPGCLHVERVSSRAMVGYQAAWADLAARTLEPNIFLGPAFALPLIQHVERSCPPDFLLVWSESHPAAFGRLIGLLPLSRPRDLPGARLVRCFAHKQTVGGAPLLDREFAAAAFAAMITWLWDREPKASALLVRGIALDGAFHAMATRGPFEYRISHRHERAILRHDAKACLSPAPEARAALTPTATFLSAKRRKELRRQRRRLSELGDRRYTSARTPSEVASATERFLELEHRGWKGARGTALLASPSLATFARTMTRLMAFEGKCRIDAIEINGRAVAMGIILTTDGRSHFWKTAFDETYAIRSPGVQFALELTEAQLADADVALTDSCAVPDHPMIDRLWPERMGVADLLINLRPADPQAFRRAVAVETLSVALRDALRRLYISLRGGKAR